ncbi:GPI-GlcNAc transferase complex, PIG-H component-domain-containing protein [Rhizophagus diaphanus]|nr:GPI-GlcNAc transferase complex, PIG-H component-domain-containing protein [Rhizophagus diaphanus] [Rhizophagus sp. MUCL 43196]
MSTSLNQEYNQYSQPSSTIILPIPNNPYFLCNILADNAREYIMLSNHSFFGLFDVIYAFILAIVLGFMNQTTITYSISIAMIIIWIWLKLNIVKEESILSIRDVGIQVKTIYMNGRSVSRFIDKSKISDIIINEGITMLQVKFYMTIIVDGQDRMVVVFEHLLPKLNILLQVYRGTRYVIFNEIEENSDIDGYSHSIHSYDINS